MDWQTFREENRRSWDQRVPVHWASAFYDVPGFLSGRDTLTPQEIELLPEVNGRNLLHLQCHFGMDTLSMARRGAGVTGVDISGEAIDRATELAAQCGLHAGFIRSDIYDLDGDPRIRGFDVVYASFGAICWLPDLEAWARIVRQALNPGGTLLLVEFHPTLYMFDFPTGKLSYPYFAHREPLTEPLESTYTDGQATFSGVDHFWSHPIAEVLTAILGAGLRLTAFREWAESPFNCFPGMVPGPDGGYRYPASDHPLPHVYGLTAERPPD